MRGREDCSGVQFVPRYVCRNVKKMESNFGGEGFVAVSDDGGDPLDGGEFFGGALRVTAGGDDAGCRVEAMRAADVSACFAIGFGGDAASVDDDHIGLGGPALAGA